MLGSSWLLSVRFAAQCAAYDHPHILTQLHSLRKDYQAVAHLRRKFLDDGMWLNLRMRANHDLTVPWLAICYRNNDLSIMCHGAFSIDLSASDQGSHQGMGCLSLLIIPDLQSRVGRAILPQNNPRACDTC